MQEPFEFLGKVFWIQAGFVARKEEGDIAVVLQGLDQKVCSLIGKEKPLSSFQATDLMLFLFSIDFHCEKGFLGISPVGRDWDGVDIQIDPQVFLCVEELDLDAVDRIGCAPGHFCGAELCLVGMDLVKSPLAFAAAGTEEEGKDK
jgi:hypothetical protein